MFSKVTEDIYYVGVNDHDIDLFEGQYDVPNGMAYNSYVVMDEKVTVFDTVDAHFTDEWMGNLAEVLGDRTPDYLIVQHMEPDHSANIAAFAEQYPEAKIVANAMTFNMRLCGQKSDGKGWREPFHRKAHLYLCVRSDGTLAGSYGDL